MALINYTTTRLIEIFDPLFEKKRIRVQVKREDQNHPFVSGNKWWKLKYNLEAAVNENHDTIMTFGGAFSNHLYATAAAAKELKLKSIGIIRGEPTEPLNATLSFAKKCGMQLQFISRELYRQKHESQFLEKLSSQYGRFYLVPEGGTNELAVKGCAEWAQSLSDEIEFDYVCLPVGTGGTMAGMVKGLPHSKKAIGISVLKGGEFLEKDIGRFTSKRNFQLVHDYHFGGYAKTTRELLDFMEKMERKSAILVDQVYTAKLFYAVYDLIQKDFFKNGSNVLILHTGGLQGRLNLNSSK